MQDEEWAEEEKLHQGFKEEEFAFLSEMLGPKGMAFDNDDILDDNDDEDLKNDPVSQIDMQARLRTIYTDSDFDIDLCFRHILYLSSESVRLTTRITLLLLLDSYQERK